jgi:flagellar hook-associated protein 3 FlgL
MNVTQSVMSRNLLSNVENLNERLETVSQQISTGKRMVHLRDSPATAAESAILAAESADLDQYKANTTSANYYLQIADSALNSVQELVTSIQTKGSAGASDTVNASDRAALAADVRSLRDQLLSIANTEVHGRYIFAGSMVTTTPFTIDDDNYPDTVTYHGDGQSVGVKVGNELEAQQNVPGSAVFKPVFDSIESLLTAMDGGDTAGIGVAIQGLTSSLAGLNLARGQVGAELNKIQNVTSELDTEEVNLRAQQSRVEDTNTAEAATQLSQLQTALSVTLTAGQSMLQQKNLFDFLA